MEGITRHQRLTGAKPVLRDTDLYLVDNGACYCGLHAGNSARYTGRDISGQAVVRLTVAAVRQSIQDYNWEPSCEQCGRKVSFVS